jgi:hypothetical protein
MTDDTIAPQQPTLSQSFNPNAVFDNDSNNATTEFFFKRMNLDETKSGMFE